MSTDLSLVSLLIEASFVVQLVLILLLVASLASWAVILQKRRVLNEFLKGRQSGPGNPVADMDKLAAAAK